MNWSSLDTWTVAIGAICAVACALPGCFLVLRRMSMMGDAISHAVLPGLAAAFLITHSRVTVVMFVGAGCVGLLTAVFTQWISKSGKVDRGAAMGIVGLIGYAMGGSLSNETWAALWHGYLWLVLIVGGIVTLWFTIGGVRDLVRLYRRLRGAQPDAADDGSVR